VETVAFHLLLVGHHPVVAWVLTLSSLSLVVWLVRDYRAMADAAVRVDRSAVRFEFGRRLQAAVPGDAIGAVSRVGWHNLPQGMQDFVNITRPAQCNVLITFREPVKLRLLNAVWRPVRHLGVAADEPDAVVAALTPAPARAGP
jgi:hypothetical protein